jgi:ribonucleotide reductase beta subunit family protein with ferritin-like domain
LKKENRWKSHASFSKNDNNNVVVVGTSTITTKAEEEDDAVSDLYFYLCLLFLFFNFADGIVSENVAIHMFSRAKINEVKNFYATQMKIESIHAETYAIIYDTMIKTLDEHFQSQRYDDDDDAIGGKSTSTDRFLKRMEKLEKFKRPNQTIETIPSIKKKKEWATYFLNDDRLPYPFRLVASVAVEGIFFSSAFCGIFWLKKRGLMPGLTFSNELISRDEGLHCDFACLLYRLLYNRLYCETIADILKSAVECELEFVDECIPERGFVGLNRTQMKQYVKYVANRWYFILTYGQVDHHHHHPPKLTTSSLSSSSYDLKSSLATLQNAYTKEDDFDVDDVIQPATNDASHPHVLYYEDENDDESSSSSSKVKKPIQNPFDFMNLLSVEGKTNFFEKDVSEYRMPNVHVPNADYFDHFERMLNIDYNSWYKTFSPDNTTDRRRQQQQEYDPSILSTTMSTLNVECAMNSSDDDEDDDDDDGYNTNYSF